MKGRMIVVVVLVIVISVQIVYLARRIMSTTNKPGTTRTMAGAPPSGPGVSVAPSGRPPQGGPSGRPVPGMPPSGMPFPPPSGGPMKGPGSAMPPPGGPGTVPVGQPGQMNVEMMPYTELLAGLVAMESDDDARLHLDANQKEKIVPLLKALSTAAQGEGAKPHDVLTTASAVLTDQQLGYINEHRNDQLSVEPGARGVAKPVLALLEKRAAEPERTVPGTPGGENQLMGPEDLLNGVLKLENNPGLKISPAQATKLRPLVTQMIDHTNSVDDKKAAIVALLGPTQRTYILKMHEAFLANSSANLAPPDQLISELLKKVE